MNRSASKAEETRRKLAELEHQVEEAKKAHAENLRQELAALEAGLPSADYKPLQKAKTKPAKTKSRAKPKPKKKSGGPQEAYWPSLIAKYAGKPHFTLDDVERDLRKMNKPQERKSIRARLVGLVKRGLVKRESDGVFSVLPRGLSGADMRAGGIIPPHARLVGER